MKYERNFSDFYRGSSDKRNEIDFFSTEVDFSIKIDNHNYTFWEYREKLCSALSNKFEHRKSKDKESSLEFFFRDRLKRMAENEQISLFVTDYREREGSFIITFSFIAFTAFMNYGQFRDSLEYLKQDFNYLLHNVFPDDTTILVDYYDRPNHLLENISKNFLRRTSETINREFRKLKIIVLFVVVLALALSSYAVYKVEKQPSQTTIDSAVIQSTIRAEIEKNNAEKNNEELLRLLRQQLEQPKMDIQNK